MRIFTLFGVPICLGVTFPIMVTLLVGGSFLENSTWIGVVEGVVRLAIIFISLMCHEFAHIFVAKYYGVTTNRVVFGIAGAAAYFDSHMGVFKPLQECKVAAAGPFMSFSIAFVCMVVGIHSSGLVELWCKQIFILNMFYALFNLLPAYPLDGGRILQAGLRYKFDNKYATRVAARIGQVFAVALVLGAFVTQMYGLAIGGVFVWRHAHNDLRNAV